MCPLSPAVCKVSSGAVEFVPSYHVKFLSDFFSNAVEKGFKIISTDLGLEEIEEETQPEKQKEDKNEAEFIFAEEVPKNISKVSPDPK